eukprot:scaffold30052_cov48-Attheya_sp.AAC.2
MHDMRIYQRGKWQLRLKAVVRGMVIWENGLNARMGYSGDSGGGGGGDFLARILVYKGKEG